jgi:hypothetical protein
MMTKYLYSYHGGNQPASAAEGEKTMKAWMDWIGSLGAKMVDPGNPTGGSKLIGSNGAVSDAAGASAVTGYSIIEAAGIDEAVKMAKNCPQLTAKGTVEVSEIMPVM